MDSDNKSVSPFSEDDQDLITGPRNRSTRRIFVAATKINQGKTTSCVGLFNALNQISKNIGYIKPIGQRFVEIDGDKIDEDSVLLNEVFDISIPIKAMSPIAVDSKFTRRYLEEPDQSEKIQIDAISRAFDRAAYEKDYIIIEGSGHAGVGACVGLSNAVVAKLLGAKVILITEGGIGSAVDEIALNKALFDQVGVPVIGAILNKVYPSKMEMVKDFAQRGLSRLGLPLLGCIPMQPILGAPNLAQVVKEIGGRWLNGQHIGKKERIHRVLIGVMTAKGIIEEMQPGCLIVTPGDRQDILLAAIACLKSKEQKRISGIILTRNILPYSNLMQMLSETDIPVIVSSDDAYTVTSKINRINIKTQPEDDDKIPIIEDIFIKNVNIDTIINSFSSSNDSSQTELPFKETK